MKTRRLGRFVVDNYIFNQPEAHAYLFTGMVIRSAREHFNFARDQTEYVAYHPSFREITEGELIPTYVAWFKDGNTSPKWVEQTSADIGKCEACRAGIK